MVLQNDVPWRWKGLHVGHANSHAFMFRLLIFYPTSGFKFSQLEMSAYIYMCVRASACVLTSDIEVVLAVLLRSFRFMSSDKEVYWNLAGVNYPTVGKGGMKAALPLKVVKV